MKEEKGLLLNKTAVLTGASRGLGFEIARVFVSNGANVIICARKKDELDTASAQLSGCRINADQKIIAITVDTLIEPTV